MFCIASWACSYCLLSFSVLLWDLGSVNEFKLGVSLELAPMAVYSKVW